MGSEKHIALQALQQAEALLEIFGDAGPRRLSHKMHSRVDRRTSKKNYFQLPAVVIHRHGEGGAAHTVAGRQPGVHRHSAERDLLAIAQNVIHFDRGIGLLLAPTRILHAATLQDRRIAFTRIDLTPRYLLQRGHPRHMVKMGLAVQ